MQAKFSGASFMPYENKIIFTASIENNVNPVADGEIFGSYIGIIHTEELKDNYQPECVILADKNQHLKIKVESVEILTKHNAGKSKLLLVTDSDGGDSEIIKVRLKRN